ncbi:MAG: hypothetical protein ACOY99_11625 [Pseudomonadota bacterium]
MQTTTDRIIFASLTAVSWLWLAGGTLGGAGAGALSRYEVSAAVRDALREAQPATAQDVRQVVEEILRRCTVTGRLTESEALKGDATDFVARIQC